MPRASPGPFRPLSRSGRGPGVRCLLLDGPRVRARQGRGSAPGIIRPQVASYPGWVRVKGKCSVCSARADALYAAPEIEGLTIRIEHLDDDIHCIIPVAEDGTRGRSWTLLEGLSEVGINADELREA